MSYKIISWNVNGIRAAAKKDFFSWLNVASPDILCLQEVKAQVEQLPETILHPNGYETFWNSAERKGYSGVATFVKKAPKATIINFGDAHLDNEGRVILTHYEEFLLFNVYFPNGGRDEVRLKYKLDFYKKFLKLIEDYRKKGHSIIFCGDVNTAHMEIDLARPKENVDNSGFMPIEREWLDKVVALGYVDTFRMFHDGNGYYSWWDQKTRSRDRNIGWRIDYFFVSPDLALRIKDAFILADVFGSDHCPVGIELSL